MRILSDSPPYPSVADIDIVTSSGQIGTRCSPKAILLLPVVLLIERKETDAPCCCCR